MWDFEAGGEGVYIILSNEMKYILIVLYSLRPLNTDANLETFDLKVRQYWLGGGEKNEMQRTNEI